VRVRRAIAYAIDRDAIVAATSYGTAVANQLAIPSGNPWCTRYDAYRYDVDMAKRLLAEAGAKPTSMDMLVSSEYPETVDRGAGDRRQPCLPWHHGQHSYRRHGHLARRAEQRALRHAHDGLARQHRSRRFLLTPSTTTGGSSNAQKYSNPEVDRLLDAGRVEVDHARVTTTTPRRATLIADQVSYLYLYNPSVIQGWTPKLTGYEARRDGAIRFRTASLNGAERQ